MNYFPFHVGDYAAHTGHLEPMEDLAYRRLLDQYYLREGPLPADIVATAKLIRMRSMQADVESVLREFFTLTEAGWVHVRCEQEIERMQDKQAKARQSAQASVNARRANAERSLGKAVADAERSLPKTPTNVELPTPTPTPKIIGAAVASQEKRAKRTQVPADFRPDKTGIDKAVAVGLDVDREVERFRDFHAGKGSVMLDWQAAWRTWVGNAVSFGKAKPAEAAFSERFI